MEKFRIKLGLSIVVLFFTNMVSAQQTALLALGYQEAKSLHAPYEFRVANFSKDEGAYGSGDLVLIISNDTKTAIINLNGTRTELRALQQNPNTECKTGTSRRQVYAKEQLRLQVKFALRAGEEACWAEGLISIRTDKHTHRYLVKGVSGL